MLVPAVSYAQTVHIDEDRIVYKGTVTMANAVKEELYERAKDAVRNNVKKTKDNIAEDNKQKGMIAVKGKIKLVTPYHLIRKVEYLLELSVDDGSYKYRIDSVYLGQVERGEKKTRISSDKLVKGVDVTGPESWDAEKLVNEIDMNFQKLLALINTDMKKPAVAKNKNRTDN